MSPLPRIFLSYARKDGEAFATALRRRLERDHPDLTLWQDRNRLEGGIGWWKQIEEALDAVRFLVVVMTPAALASETTRKEWRYARQKGVRVYPVKGVPDGQMPWASLPKWMSKAHFFDAGTVAGGEFQPGPEWESFIRNLQTDHPPPRVPFMAPDVPEGFVPRPAEFDQLLGHLLAADRQNPVAITTALAGAGGFGKTTLAIALCHHDDVITAYDDGILWAALGENPDAKRELTKLYAALTGERPAFLDEEDAAHELALKLESRNCLLVVDDVWQAAHLRPFLRGGKGCARLLTTRQFELLAVAHAEARRVNVDEMRSQEAVDVLIHGLESRPADHAPFRALARRLGEWPLLLGLANGALRQRMARGDSLTRALDYLGQALDRQGLTAFDQRNAAERHGAVSKTLGVSLDLLTPEERDRYAELAIFPEDTDIPLSVVGALWDKDGFETEQLVTTLANFSLLKFELQRGTLRLHDVLRSYLARQLPDAAALHQRLLSGWGDFHKLPDDYAWRWVAWHLVQAGQAARLRELLLDFNWLPAKLNATDVGALIADFDYLSGDAELRLVQDAIRLSAHAVGPDKKQLAGQLVGRMSGESTSQLQRLVASACAWRGAPWLRPLKASLHPPGTALLRTLQGHSGRIKVVALSPDGQRAVSGADDESLKVWEVESSRKLRGLEGDTYRVGALALSADGRIAIIGSSDQALKVWDVERGRKLRTLQGYGPRVSAVALSADGRRAVSGADDGTLKGWDVGSGWELRALKGHPCGVSAVAVSANGRRAVSGSDDHTLKVWDMESGRELRTLVGHAYRVNALALSTDGRRAVSGSDDGTLRVWEIESGLELRALRGHTDRVTALALIGDGRRAVSGSDDHTLKVWDLEAGRELRTLKGHTCGVSAVALSADGRRALSGDEDGSPRIWDLDSTRHLRQLSGHSAEVTTLALSADGRRAVSGSEDKTLKVWDARRGEELRSLEKHAYAVSAVAVSADGRRAVSTADDPTMRVWDMRSGRELRMLQGNAERVTAVSLSANGRRAVSGSDDQTLKVWDVESGLELRTFKNHADGIRAVALSADGRRALSVDSDWPVTVWDVESGMEERALQGHSLWVYSVALSASGRYAVSGANDHTLKVWDVESARCLATFTGESPMLCCALASEGRVIVAGEESGRIHFLRLVLPEDPVECGTLNAERGTEYRREGESANRRLAARPAAKTKSQRYSARKTNSSSSARKRDRKKPSRKP